MWASESAASHCVQNGGFGGGAGGCGGGGGGGYSGAPSLLVFCTRPRSILPGTQILL